MRHEEIAYSLGYRITEDGRVIGITGKERKLQLAGTGYLRFSYNKKYPAIRVHRFQAYQKFRDKIYEPGMVVRHLDGNPQNNSAANIDIGTMQQNILDRAAEARQLHARRAAAFLRSLTDNQVTAIREAYATGTSGVALAAKYNVRKSTISEIVTGKIYDDVDGPIALPKNRGRSIYRTGCGTA